MKNHKSSDLAEEFYVYIIGDTFSFVNRNNRYFNRKKWYDFDILWLFFSCNSVRDTL